MVNAEKLVMDWLNSCKSLVGYKARMVMPEKREERCITIEQTGGSSSFHASNATIAVQVWATTRWDCSRITTDVVVPRLMGIVELPEVASVSVESVFNFPSPDYPTHNRYQILIQLVLSN